MACDTKKVIQSLQIHISYQTRLYSSVHPIQVSGYICFKGNEKTEPESSIFFRIVCFYHVQISGFKFTFYNGVNKLI